MSLCVCQLAGIPAVPIRRQDGRIAIPIADHHEEWRTDCCLCCYKASRGIPQLGKFLEMHSQKIRSNFYAVGVLP
jgi:hypothetical protein